MDQTSHIVAGAGAAPSSTDLPAPRKGARIWGWTVFGLALLPVLLATIRTEELPRGRRLSGEKSLPPLALVRYAVNMRELPALNVVPAHFDFWNRSRDAIEITRVEPSCGCLSPVFADRKNVYQPGEEGQLFVSVKTANEPPGPALQWVKVHYQSGGRSHEQLVTFRYTIPELKVSVTPVQLNFYQLNGESGSGELQVVDSRKRNLQVTAARSPDELLELEVGERSMSSDGVPTTKIHVRVPGPVAAGRRNTLVIIQTDDPNYPELRVPVVIQGPSELQLTSGVRTEIESAPPRRRQPRAGE